jgi:DNA-damage-inducible protein D
VNSIEPSNPFDAIREVDANGEFWSARKLQFVMGYDKWERFEDAIERARLTDENTGGTGGFSRLREEGPVGRPRGDWRLSRYAAYLVAMNGDPRKQEVASAQSYFAVKTRQAETAVPVLDPMNNTEHLSLILTAGHAALTRAIEAEAKVAQLEPAAEAWEQLVADSDGRDLSMREAAQVLSRDDGISIGQNRLFVLLREWRWLDSESQPYQSQVDCGRVSRRVTDYTDNYGQRFVKVQPRLTVKGLAEVRKRLTPPADPSLRVITGGAS